MATNIIVNQAYRVKSDQSVTIFNDNTVITVQFRPIKESLWVTLNDGSTVGVGGHLIEKVDGHFRVSASNGDGTILAFTVVKTQ